MTRESVLQLCTKSGLDSILIDGVSASTVLAACVQVESNFDQYALNLNKDVHGNVLSIDYGICQINDFWHIGPEKDFPTPEYVLSNPEACIAWMIKAFKNGQEKMWSSFINGEYKKFLT